MRQLSLFKGPKQRGVRPPPALEFNSHVVVADLCRRWMNPGWRFTHIPSGEHRDHRIGRNGKRYSPTGNRLKRMGLIPGWPDFVFAGPVAHVAWLELKRKKLGRISDAQDDIGTHLKACGFHFLTTDDVGEAVRWLQQLDILPSKIKVQ